MPYVLKGTNMAILVEAIHQVLAGRRYLSPPLSNAAIEAYLQRATDVDRPIDTYEMLTAHEREVLLLASQGRSDAEIGKRLSIHERVIESDRASILRKLGLSTQGDLVTYAMKRGIIHEA